MALEEDHDAYNPEDIDEEEDDEESGDFNHASINIVNAAANLKAIDLINNPSGKVVVVDDDDDDVDVDEDEDVDDSTSSSNLGAVADDPDRSALNHHRHLCRLPPPPVAAVAAPAAREVTVALTPDPSRPDRKHPRADEVTMAAIAEGKKPVPIDESRRLFQRLWTDEDEIELLQGFLEYTTSRGITNSSHHHDTTAFYDQIKSKLQLDFNKNQLVEKLRRLKKKYRNVVSKMDSGKEYVFKSPHDQATYEISRKIWGGNGSSVAASRGVVAVEEGGYDDDEANNNFSINFIDQSPNPNFISNHTPSPNFISNHTPNPNGIDSLEKKAPRSRKRSRGGVVKIEEKQFGSNSVPSLQHCNLQQNVGLVLATETPTAGVAAASVAGVVTGPGPGLAPKPATNLIEETVRSCLSPIFKELLNSVMNLNGPLMGSSRGFGFALSPMPLGLNGDMVADEKWRKQQILELEVYSKRLELVQDQIKTQLEELRSMGGL